MPRIAPQRRYLPLRSTHKRHPGKAFDERLDHPPRVVAGVTATVHSQVSDCVHHQLEGRDVKADLMLFSSSAQQLVAAMVAPSDVRQLLISGSVTKNEIT